MVLASLLIVAGSALGQDLGSSNKLFGGTKVTAESSKKSAKRTSKPAASKSHAAPKKSAVHLKIVKSKPTSAGKAAASMSKNSLAPSAKVIETPAQGGGTSIPTGSAAESMFEDLIESGNKARDDRNYADAESAYKKAKGIRPKDPRAPYGLGNLYSDQQRWTEAESAYRAALQLDPGNATSAIALSYVLTQPIAVANLANRYEEAEKLARRALQYAPSNALAYDQLGVSLELRGLIGAETESAYRRAILLDSSFAPAYAHLGRLLRRRGLTAESDAAYKKAIDLADNVAVKVLVAEIMQSEQRFAESEKLLRKAIESDSHNQTALLLLGRALITLGKFGDAERILRMSLEVDPNGFLANSLMSSLFIRQGKFAQAENALLQSLRFVMPLEKRQLSQQFESVGDGYLKIGKFADAERSYRQAQALDPEKPALSEKLAKAKRG